MKKSGVFINYFYLIVTSIVISAVLLFLLYGIIQLEEQFEGKMVKIATSDIIKITQNSARDIKRSIGESQSYVAKITQNPKLKKSIDNKLSILLTENIKYAYLVYQDENNIFRFLADGSPFGEKAYIRQKLDVQSPKWQDVYKTKSPILINQPLLHQLAFTYLEPILQEDKVKAILVIDFSIEKTKEVNQVINSVKNIIKFIIFIIVVVVFIVLFQVVKYYMMKKSAYTDNLTKLYNRNYLHEAVAYIDMQKYILAVLDIDHFKKLNDTYGHSFGDIVLEEISKVMILSTRLREDILIRYGGEEFLILLKKQEEQDEKNSLKMIERIFKNIQDLKIPIEGETCINITVSIGVNLAPGESKNFDKAFRLADKALYKAKQNGRNQIIIHSDE